MTGPTIKDVGRVAGVSFKTVSRVINREPQVSKATRERVEAVMAQLNYRPNTWARMLRNARSRLIALICHDAGNPYMNQIQVSAMTACQRASYHLVVEEWRRGQPDRELWVSEMIASLHLDGVLLVQPLSDNSSVLSAVESNGIPFVRISPFRRLALGSHVSIDERSAAYDMTCHLLELGHRDIAFIPGPASHGGARERHKGFLAAMSEYGARARRHWIVPGDFSVASGVEAAKRLLAGPGRPTAIFASNDEMAVGVISVAHHAGLALPRDLSVVGFDDSPAASSTWPALTTVRQPVADLSRVAAEMLIADIETPGARRSEKLDYSIIVRESTAPPP